MKVRTSVRTPRVRRRVASIGLVAAIACGGALAAAVPASAEERAETRATSTEPAWVSPTRGTVTEVFDPVSHRFAKVANDCGTPVYASAAGTVTAATDNGGAAGVMATIDHGAGVSTSYGFLAYPSLLVAIGDHVETGELIAVTGSTGMTIGCGLRFAVSDATKAPRAQNPVTFLAERGVTLGG